MSKPIVFRDRVKVYVFAGNGGDGVIRFRREKFVPRGGPDGGDGGRGGHVILKGSKDEDSLLSVYYEPHLRGQHGGHGSGAQCHGKNGSNKTVRVPCGTEVRVEETDELLGEVLEDGEELVIARGGRGGLGNMHFATPSHQAPRECTEGTPGEEKRLVLTLKLVADVALVGYPNAGKSTLLTVLTAAHPKVAPYPFTTLHPMIGTLIYDHDYFRLRIADVPGLIDGAHEGVGLGHKFLRHIERTRFLVFVIDIAGIDGRDPVQDYRGLRRELEAYDAELNKRPYLVVANKMDMPESDDNLRRFREETGEDPIPMCAEIDEGVDALQEKLRDVFQALEK